jgi:PEP-CTERM motif
MRTASFPLLTILCLMLAVAPAMAQVDLYDNGPYNGTTDAWAINYGSSVSNSFLNVLFQLDITSIQFVYWDASTTDVLTTVDMGVGGAPFSFANFSGTLTGVTNTDLGSNQWGYELFQANFPVSNAYWGYFTLGWVTLQNACTTSGCSVSNPIYWDENSGVGCEGENCPSFAYASTIGSIPSETFTLTGYYTGGGTPEPSSIIVFGSGILGVAGMLRRRKGC